MGAKHELEAALMEMDNNDIRGEPLKDSCDRITWKMNVPHSIHMGGVWERQFRTSCKECTVGITTEQWKAIRRRILDNSRD